MYSYRGLPCSCWCVSGHDEANNISGVLEWCTDEMDAHRTMRVMRAERQFSYLRAHKYNTEGIKRIDGLIASRSAMDSRRRKIQAQRTEELEAINAELTSLRRETDTHTQG